jgi:hypothetical protein
MSAFGGEADMTLRGNPLSRSLLGVKRTWVGAPQMSAFDPSGHRYCAARLLMTQNRRSMFLANIGFAADIVASAGSEQN